MTRLVDVPHVDHRRAGGAEGVCELRRLLDDAVFLGEGGCAGGREGALLADRVVLEVDDEESGCLRIELHALTVMPSASAISLHVPTVATFCIA